MSSPASTGALDLRFCPVSCTMASVAPQPRARRVRVLDRRFWYQCALGRDQQAWMDGEANLTDSGVGIATDTPIVEIEELQGLITSGQERGFLSAATIAAALEEAEASDEQ